MIAGSVLAGIAVAAAIAAFRTRSRVARGLDRVAPAPASAPTARGRRGPVRVASLVGAGAAAAGLVMAASLPPMFVVAALYAGYVAPALVAERRAAARLAGAERALATWVEELCALAASGRPVEAAIVAIARRPSRSIVLDTIVRDAADAYALGAPLFHAIAYRARRAGLDRLASLAEDLGRARDLGRGTVDALAAARDSLRARERAIALEAASRVEGRLMLVLVLCYVPALMLLVVVPLFMRLLDGLLL